MVHTVQTLSKLLKKTPDEVITILANAGVDGKNSDSVISAEEKKKFDKQSFKALNQQI